MELNAHWPKIMKVFEKAMGNYAVATVTADGNPYITPIGSIFLRDDMTGFYFEQYPKNLVENLKANSRVAVLAVNFHKVFWLHSFLRGNYPAPPAVRLFGVAGERRRATSQELARFRNSFWVRIIRLMRLKGYGITWEPMHHVRDIRFDSFEPIVAGEMTRGNW